jgi:hypothetical protein
LRPRRLAGGLLALLAVALTASAACAKEHIAFDFRTRMEKMPALRLSGPDAEIVARTDSQGLRLTLPDERQDTNVVGVDLPVRIRGDFDIVLTYELLTVSEPPLGAGVHLRLKFDSPTQLDATVIRVRSPMKDEAASFRVVHDPQTLEKWLWRGRLYPKESHGKLRIVRIGPRLQYFAADGQGEFADIGSEDFGAADVKLVRAFASSGWKPVITDLRLIDLTIDADSFPDGVAANASADSPDATETPAGIEGQRWVVVVAVLGLLLFGAAIVVGVWLFLRYRPAQQPQPAPAPTTTLAAGVVSFPCPECGKSLRAKSELAGRKVKCTQCACAVVVPANRRRTPPHGMVRSS